MAGRTVRIGTSGWVYKDWAGTFYPEKVKGTDRLLYYTTRFNTVEINATFYRSPTQAMLNAWNERLPRNFHLVVKGPRFITHFQKLIDPKGSALRFCQLVGQLRHLRIVLWQLPPVLPIDLPRLDTFLAQLPKTVRHAVEFRHVSWWHPETLDVLQNHRASFVAISHPQLPDVIHATTNFLYLRFHGLGDNLYRYDYSRSELLTWAMRLKPFLATQSLYVYFNNDWHANAPRNAEVLRDLLQEA